MGGPPRARVVGDEHPFLLGRKRHRSITAPLFAGRGTCQHKKHELAGRAARSPTVTRSRLGDQRLAVTWNLQDKTRGLRVRTRHVADRHDDDPRATRTGSRRGHTVFYLINPTGGTDTPASTSGRRIARRPTLFESYVNLGGDRTLGHHLRATPGQAAPQRQDRCYMVGRPDGEGAKQLLFDNPATSTASSTRSAPPAHARSKAACSSI